MSAAVKTLQRVMAAPLQCRVGIATGMVIVGDFVRVGARRDLEIVGDPPELAARLQISAEPDTVVIESATKRLVGILFECRDLGAITISCGGEALRRWQVLGERIVESRFEALRGSALSPLIGRDEEIGLLLRRWARAKAGDGQIVLISGEAGIGKSRLTIALEERLHAEPHLRLRYFCSPHHQDSALSPFVDQLARASGFAHDDPPEIKLEKLRACSPASSRRTRIWCFLPTCCHCRCRSATRCHISAHSAKRKEHSKHCSGRSKVCLTSCRS